MKWSESEVASLTTVGQAYSQQNLAWLPWWATFSVGWCLWSSHVLLCCERHHWQVNATVKSLATREWWLTQRYECSHISCVSSVFLRVPPLSPLLSSPNVCACSKYWVQMAQKKSRRRAIVFSNTNYHQSWPFTHKVLQCFVMARENVPTPVQA